MSAMPAEYEEPAERAVVVRMADKPTYAGPIHEETERFVILNFVENPVSRTVYVAKLEEKHFTSDRNRALFVALVELHKAGKAIDALSLLAQLQTSDAMAAVGSREDLVAHFDGVFGDTAPERAVEILHDAWRMRSACSAAAQIVRRVQAGYEAQRDLELIVERFRKLAGDTRANASLTSQEIADQIIEETLRDPTEEDPSDLIPTGFRSLDNLTCGVGSDDLIIVGARPGTGKTTFLAQAAYQFAIRKNRSVLFISAEMPAKHIFRRVVSSIVKVPYAKPYGGFSDEQKRLIVNASKHIAANIPIRWEYMQSPSVSELYAIADRARRDDLANGKTLSLVVVDYFNKIRRRDGFGKTHEKWAEVACELKQASAKMGIPWMVGAQLVKDTVEKGKARKPVASDLAETRQLEFEANTILLLHREDENHKNDPEYEPTHEVDIIVAKQRNGGPGSVKMHFNAPFFCFEELK